MLILKYSNTKTLPDRWDNIFLLESVLWSRQSHDLETQCGCVIVKDKTRISSGYNGFIRDIDDSILPKKRPKKYPFMIHAEANAIYNCVRNGIQTLGCKIYITGVPCLSCLQAMYQCGIKDIIFSNISEPRISAFSEEYEKILKMIYKKINLIYIDKRYISTDYLLESKNKILGTYEDVNT